MGHSTGGGEVTRYITAKQATVRSRNRELGGQRCVSGRVINPEVIEGRRLGQRSRYRVQGSQALHFNVWYRPLGNQPWATCLISMETVSLRADYNDNGRNQKRTANVEILRNALGRRAENLVSRNCRAVAGGVARRNVDAGAHQPARRA